MELIGGNLKKTRESKHLSLNSVSNSLNISVYILESIENDDFSNIHGEAYTIGYIRSYSNYLDLNADDIVKLYKEQVFFANQKVPMKIKKPIESFNFFLSNKLISILGVISLSLSFYFLFIVDNDFFPKYAITPEISENIQARIEEIEFTNALTELKKERKDLLKDESNNQFLISRDNLNKDVNTTAAIASIDDEMLVDLVTIKSLTPTWIQLRNSNNEIIFSSLMQKNDEYSYDILDEYLITAGNAGNLMVLINGEVKGKLGKKGEVIEKLIISSDFFN